MLLFQQKLNTRITLICGAPLMMQVSICEFSVTLSLQRVVGNLESIPGD